MIQKVNLGFFVFCTEKLYFHSKMSAFYFNELLLQKNSYPWRKIYFEGVKECSIFSPLIRVFANKYEVITNLVDKNIYFLDFKHSKHLQS